MPKSRATSSRVLVMLQTFVYELFMLESSHLMVSGACAPAPLRAARGLLPSCSSPGSSGCPSKRLWVLKVGAWKSSVSVVAGGTGCSPLPQRSSHAHRVVGGERGSVPPSLEQMTLAGLRGLKFGRAK